MFEIAIRLLKNYRSGIVKQMVIIGKYDHKDSRRLSVKDAPQFANKTDWQRSMEILKAVDAEIKLLENQ